MQLIKMLFLVLLITGATVGVFFLSKSGLTSSAEGLYWYNKGTMAYRHYDYEEARDDYMRAIPLHPEPAKVYLRLGDTEYHLGNEEAALHDYRKALDLEPRMKEAVIRVADKEWVYGHRKLALSMYRDAIKHYPNDEMLNLKLAEMYMIMGRETGDPDCYDSALAIYKRFADKQEYLKYRIAEVHYARGRFNQALGIYCGLAESHPYNAETLYSLALTLDRLDAEQEAYKTMVKAAELMDLRNNELSVKWINKAMEFQHNRRIYSGLPADNIYHCMQHLRLSETEHEEEAP